MEETNITNSPENTIEQQENAGIANSIIDLIKRKYEIVAEYNNLKEVANSINRSDLVEALTELSNEESADIGVLTGILTMVDISAEKTIEAAIDAVD